MWQFSITYNSITTIIDEPVGWDETEIIVKRNKDYHGVLFDYTFNKLRYHNEGFTILKNAYDAEGMDAEAELLIEYACSDTDTYEELYRGRFVFGQIKILEGDGCFIEIPIEQIGCVNTFLNRIDQKVNLNSNKDFSDNGLTAYTRLNSVLDLPEKEILLTTDFTDPLDFTKTEIQPTQALTNYFYTLGFNEINSDEINVSDSTPYELIAQPLENLYPLTNGIINIRPETGITTLGSIYNIRVDLDGQFNEVSNFGNRTYTANIVLRIVDRNNVPKLSTTLGTYGGTFAQGVTNSQPINILYINQIALEPGDKIYLYLFVAMTFTTAPIPPTNIPFSLDLQYTSGNFNVNTLSVAVSTTARVAFVYEAMARTVEAITDDCMTVRSNYYALSGSQPYQREQAGCGSLRVITNGLLIRKKLLTDNTVPPITVSFQNMLEGLSPIDNIGYGIEDDPSRPTFKQVRVEPFEYFYDFQNLLTFNGVREIATSVDESRVFSNIEIGYGKWESEQFNGLDEINTKRTYRTVLSSVKSNLTKLSSFIASGYALEITRRIGAGSSDSRFDDDIFIIQLKKQGITFFVEFFTNLQIATQNLITPFTTYNIRLSPIRNLMRWFPIIQASWSKIATSPVELKFTEGQANYKAETRIFNNNCLAENNLSLLPEDKDISKNDLLGVTPNPIFEPELIKFEFPLSYQQWKQIRLYPYRKINILGNFGQKSGWIDMISYAPNKGIATFTLLKQYGS